MGPGMTTITTTRMNAIMCFRERGVVRTAASSRA